MNDTSPCVGRVSPTGVTRQFAAVVAERGVGLRCANPTYTAEWRRVSLKEVTSVLGDGLHGTPEYDPNGDYFFINGNNLSKGKIIFNDTTKRVSAVEAAKHPKNLTNRTILARIFQGSGRISSNPLIQLGLRQ